MVQDSVKRVLHYPELYDRLHNENRATLQPVPPVLIQPCVTSFIRGQCASGHFYAKALVCGREWCPDCGKDGSAIHKRRIARWWPKVMQMKKVGYLVFTVPEELRETFRDTEELKAFRKYITRKLQRMGYDKGLSRYHWAGDCPICNGHGCNCCRFTGADTVYKPHLNVLIESGFINKMNGNPKEFVPGTTITVGSDFDNKINLLKTDLQAWFNDRYKDVLKQNELLSFVGNVYYSYCGLHKKTKTDMPHRIHKLKYITRSTMRVHNSEFAAMIKGFRTTSTWGKWVKSELPRTSDLVTLEHGQCPECLKQDGVLEPITWGGFIGVHDFIKFTSREHIEAGYFLLNSS